MSIRHYIVTDKIGDDGRMRDIIRIRIAEKMKELAGKTVTIEIREPNIGAGGKERAFYFAAYVAPIREYFASHGQLFGQTELHEDMMVEIGGFITERENPITGVKERKRRSFNELDDNERRDYYVKIEHWCGQRGIALSTAP